MKSGTFSDLLCYPKRAWSKNTMEIGRTVSAIPIDAGIIRMLVPRRMSICEQAGYPIKNSSTPTNVGMTIRASGFIGASYS